MLTLAMYDQMEKNTETSLIKTTVVNRCFWIILIISSLVLIFGVLSRFSIFNIWDDAFMFVRYADNLMKYGKLSWNPGMEPSYGLTSILYLIVITPIRILTSNNPALTAMLSSMLCGFLFIGLSILLVFKYIKATPTIKYSLVLLTLISLALANEHLSAHFCSGMDTTFAMSYITLYLIIAIAFERSSSLKTGITLGIIGGLAFSVRPDIMLFSYIVPFSIILFAREALTWQG